MALETLKGVTEIGGFDVVTDSTRDNFFEALCDDTIPSAEDWGAWDEFRKSFPIQVDHKANMISFRIQNGPIKENGVNGCQVDTLIHAAKTILEGLNEKFPSVYNAHAIKCLSMATDSLDQRTKNRERRGVEGTSNE